MMLLLSGAGAAVAQQNPPATPPQAHRAKAGFAPGAPVDKDTGPAMDRRCPTDTAEVRECVVVTGMA